LSLTTIEQRPQGRDRRQYPRGGRRPTDRPGCGPLILIVEPDARRRALCEATFERLKFAVAAFPEAAPAVAALSWFSPDVVVIDRREVRAFRAAAPAAPHDGPPLVEISPDVEPDESVVDAVRVALRSVIARKSKQAFD
jgi:hypothetical protein